MIKIKELFRKVVTKEVLFYILFGILTTIVNLGSFYLMNNLLKWNENLSNFLAIIFAVIIAYITNKDLVFHSKAEKKIDRLMEFIKFIIGRAFTIALEFIGGILLFRLPIPNIISKTFITILVIVLNFFISKFFAFKKVKNE